MRRLALITDTMTSTLESIVEFCAQSWDVLLVSDARSPRVESLVERAGIELMTASHRMIDSGDGMDFSDADLAGRLGEEHTGRPFDALLYATDALVDLSWYEPKLRPVPKGRAVVGLLTQADVILRSSDRFESEGERLMALAGDTANSDFVVTVAGIQPISRSLLPPTTEIPVQMARGDGVEFGGGNLIDTRGMGIQRSVELVERIAASRGGILLAVGSDRDQGVAIQERTSSEVAERVIFVADSDSWLEDVLTLAKAMDAEDRSARPESSAALPSAFEDPVMRSTPQVRIAPSTEPAEISRLLHEMIASGSEETLLVATDPRMASDLMFDGSRASLADLAFVARQVAPMGDLHPRFLRDDVVFIGSRARWAALEAADLSADLRSLIHRLTEPSLVASVAVGLLPGDVPGEPLALRTVRAPDDRGFRVEPSLLSAPNARAEPHPPPPPLPPPSPEVPTPREWVGRQRWGTRWRLALPWRWNLLPRAMRDRW